MNLHTIVYNNSDINLPKYKLNISNLNIIIWNYNLILDLIKKKYSNYLVYYKRLILNKSRENFAKYIIIKEYGGIFININLLKLLNYENYIFIENHIMSEYDMIFWLETNSKNLSTEIFKIDNFILNDDIIIIKNKSNSFICDLIKNIDINKIPINEYQNKIYLGNIFLSIQLDNFYLSNLNIIVNKQSYWFNNLKNKFKIDNKNIYEKSIYYVNLIDFSNFDLNYKLITYPNIPDLKNPEKILNSWNSYYKIKDLINNIFISIVFTYSSWNLILVSILIISVINFLINNYIVNYLNIEIKQAQIDSQIFFYPKKFKFFKELQKNWKIIQEEAMEIMKNSPKLNISRKIEDWHDSKLYFNSIKNKHGWIRSWNYDSETKLESDKGNYEWLNYGLYYFGEKFNENIKQCPRTIKILDNISTHINICGFSWMYGGCILQPHTDITGLSTGSLAMHLGLIIPIPKNTCKLIIKNSNNDYIYMNEKNGKIIVFDATWEHYAYNQSNEDRIILYIDFKIEIDDL